MKCAKCKTEISTEENNWGQQVYESLVGAELAAEVCPVCAAELGHADKNLLDNPATLAAVYQADCDEFDNNQTGWHETEAEALAAFETETHFSANEQKRVRPYTRQAATSPETLVAARCRSFNGSPSPAFGIDVA